MPFAIQFLRWRVIVVTCFFPYLFVVWSGSWDLDVYSFQLDEYLVRARFGFTCRFYGKKENRRVGVSLPTFACKGYWALQLHFVSESGRKRNELVVLVLRTPRSTFSKKFLGSFFFRRKFSFMPSQPCLLLLSLVRKQSKQSKNQHIYPNLLDVGSGYLYQCWRGCLNVDGGKKTR
jgi:hypothetical protein